jgi:Flp pilus assembly protein TadG
MNARSVSFLRSAKNGFSNWWKSQPGNIAIISALAMPCLVGFCGMGADVGYWYYRQRVVQAAVDVTAYDAIVAMAAGASTATIKAGASSDASANGWKSSSGKITVNMPPTTGTHKDANSAEIIITENEPRFFTEIFSHSTVKISGRAVASYTGVGNACMLALNKTAKNAFQFWGHNTSTLKNCNAVSDSLNAQGLSVGGNSNVTAPCLISAGGVYVTSTLTLTSCHAAISHAQYTPDPYKSVAAPTIPKNCTNAPGGKGNYSPGRYCGGLSIKDTRTLNSGVYIIDGGKLDLNASANITGTGVMFYLTNGAVLNFNGNAQFNLTAPTTAPYVGGQAGMLFFSDRSQANANQSFNGTSNSVLTGALYFPTQALTINGDYNGKNGCMQVVADTITYSGNATLTSTCPGTGLTTILTASGASLVE